MSYKVTVENLVKFENEIVKAAEMLQLATLSLRSLYVINSSSVESFVKLRQKITKKAKVYTEIVLPASNDLIRAIQNFCNFYNYVDFNGFTRYIEFFTKEAGRNTDNCKSTLKLYNSILAEFRSNEDEVIAVLQQLKLKTKEYEQKKDVLMKSANVRLDWAISLALIPVVNVIAGPILFTESNKKIESAIAESEEQLLAVAAADTIRGPLIMSITELVKIFDYICKLFIAMTDELNNIEGEDSTHYYIMKEKGPTIVKACRTYLSKIPDAVANLQAIPDDYDKNYVKEWLSRRS